MSMVASIHRPTVVKAESSNGANWITFRKGDNRVDVFCPNAEVARATADAFNDAMAYSQAEAAHEPA